MAFKNFLRKPVSERESRLRALSLLETLTPSELRNVDALLHEREYVEREIVFDQGEEGQALYIVLEGIVVISRNIEGVEQFVTEYRPGEFFGELALVDHGVRTAQARAATNCRLAVLFREDFVNIINIDAVAASKMTLQMARHLAHLLRQGAAQANKSLFFKSPRIDM